MEETGVTNVVDPLGGSWYVEAFTDKMEKDAEAYFERIDKIGGIVAATEKGWVQREIGDAAYKLQREYESGERKIVGVNAYVDEDQGDEPEILKIDDSTAKAQAAALSKLRKTRDNRLVEKTLAAVKTAARDNKNVMPALIDAAKAYATLGEISDAFREVFGTWREGRDF